MDAFTSSSEELNEADIQRKSAEFTGSEVSFSAKLDSKGRITVPAKIRDRLSLEKGDELRLDLKSGKVLRKNFSSKSEALGFLSGLEGVEKFSFSSGTLEVVIRD